MKILINGDATEVADAIVITDLIEQLKLAGQAFAIAVNRRVVPRSQYEKTTLQAEDEVELVRAVGGG